MNRPSFVEGVTVALAACLGGGALHGALAMFAPAATALRLSIALVGLGYGAYLLYRSPRRSGRTAAPAAWLLLSAAVWSLGATVLAATQLLLVWLIRARSFQRGALTALADLALLAGGVGAALWAWVHSGSFALALWCFFLIQALFSALPGLPPEPAAERFERAYREALSALHKL